VIGSLPLSMRMLGFLAGYHGDKARGLATVEQVAQKGQDNRIDAKIILCALYRREGQAQRAIPMVRALIEQFPRNYLLRFELAQMYAAAGRRREALDALGDIARMKEANAPGYGRIPAPKIAYEMGNLEFWFDDLGESLKHLQQATASPDDLKALDLNTAVIALMRQGQIYDLQHQHELAVPIYRGAAALAPEAEAAKESVRYISRPYKRAARQ
jgi:tetratricopeptide (TPR) repeat protein